MYLHHQVRRDFYTSLSPLTIRYLMYNLLHFPQNKELTRAGKEPCTFSQISKSFNSKQREHNVVQTWSKMQYSQDSTFAQTKILSKPRIPSQGFQILSNKTFFSLENLKILQKTCPLWTTFYLRVIHSLQAFTKGTTNVLFASRKMFCLWKIFNLAFWNSQIHRILSTHFVFAGKKQSTTNMYK